MSVNKYLISTLLSTAMTLNPAAVEAGNMSHIGSSSQTPSMPVGLNCKSGAQTQGVGSRPTTINNNIQVYKPVTVNNDVTVYKPVNVNNNLNVVTNIDSSKNISVYKPVSIVNNIDASKNIEINKPISISQNIDASKNINITKNINASKNININKTIIINKGGGSQSSSSSQADAAAEASAVASAVASAIASSNSSSSAVVNFNGSSNSSASANSSSYNSSGGSESSSSAFGYSGAGTVIGGNSYIAEVPGAFAGGDFGALAVDTAPALTVPAPPTQCTFQDTTVIKAIHAVCIAADKHEFPASHMTGDTWIAASYEGEIARCIPGSHLKVVIGKVMQSSEGMATGYTSGQVLECGLHEAVRHYKDGLLKCAPALPVPDCTERTNLRKYGSGDMFFTYRARICLETHEEYPATASIDEDRR